MNMKDIPTNMIEVRLLQITLKQPYFYNLKRVGNYWTIFQSPIFRSVESKDTPIFISLR